MTQYGRGQGSEPWHPEDPLYGDGGWGGQQAQQPPYDGQPQHHPQQPQQPQQGQYGDWGNGPQDAYGQGQQPYPQQYEGQQHPQYAGQGQQEYAGQGAPQQYSGQGGQQEHQGGWDTGAQGQPQVPYPADPADPYGNQAGAYGADQPDFYGTPDAYPPPEPPARRGDEPEKKSPETGWDAGPDQGEHAFFAGGDDEDEDDDGPGERAERGDRRGRGGKGAKGKGGKKGRNGVACLVVVLVLGGGVGGVGYFGYQFYQNRFGQAPDFIGEGTEVTVTVTVAGGASGYTIGQELKKAGVVKSVDAFVTAQANNPDGDKIQAGVYVLKEQMSAASAVALMLDPKSRNNLVIAEGQRNVQIYKAIDKRLELEEGTTKSVAEDKWSTLGLPDWANGGKEIKDPLEGFLYPSSYPVAKGMKPEDVLREMITLSKQKYNQFGLEKTAESLDLDNPLQVLTVASLVQAEGKYKHDFEKVARVIYNRLDPGNTETYGLLDFDSTVNYLRGESKLATGSVDSLRQIDDPYNTYKIKGLPPGPIGNPGQEAIEASLHPTEGDWYYFVSINEDETLFAVTNEEHNRNREKYEEAQKNGQ